MVLKKRKERSWAVKPVNDQVQNRAERQHLNMSPESSNVIVQTCRHLQYLPCMYAVGTGKNGEVILSSTSTSLIRMWEVFLQAEKKPSGYQPLMLLNTIPKHNSFPSHLLLLEAAIPKTVRFLPLSTDNTAEYCCSHF